MTFFTVWLVLWEQLTVQFFLSICCCCTLDKQCWWTGRRSWCTKQSWQSAVFDGFMKFYESEKRSAAVAAQPTMTSAVAVKVFLRCLNISLGKVGLNESVSFWMNDEPERLGISLSLRFYQRTWGDSFAKNCKIVGGFSNVALMWFWEIKVLISWCGMEQSIAAQIRAATTFEEGALCSEEDKANWRRRGGDAQVLMEWMSWLDKNVRVLVEPKPVRSESATVMLSASCVTVTIITTHQ